MIPLYFRSCLGLVVLAFLITTSIIVNAGSSSDVGAPSPGPARVIGGAASGCIAGAVGLPTDGPGFQAIRISRNRHFAHPDTVAFVQQLGKTATAAGLSPFYVGDMSQSRGGPMPFGHGAHMNGLDVDIWFNLDPKPPLAPNERETVDLPSMVLADQTAIDPARFGERQVRLLRLAASDATVDRIFVHWTIKRALCDGLAGANEGDRSWLHRIRPWRGHEEHFHVRLTCPKDSPDCERQSPIPAGNGCDETLDWWFRPRSAEAPPTTDFKPPRKLPPQCQALLSNR